MRTLEVIHLRLAGDDPERLAEVARASVGGPSEGAAVRIYRHARVENDLLVHIERENGEGTDRASDLGVELATLLRQYGLVEHSVWVVVGG